MKTKLVCAECRTKVTYLYAKGDDGVCLACLTREKRAVLRKKRADVESGEQEVLF